MIPAWFESLALWVGYAAFGASAILGVVLLLCVVYGALLVVAHLYIKRILTVSVNWYHVHQWVHSGRPTWQSTTDSTGARTYQRMVPQDGPATDIPEIVPVRVQARLGALIDTVVAARNRDDGEDTMLIIEDGCTFLDELVVIQTALEKR